MRQVPAEIAEFGRKVRQNQSAIVLIIANLVPLGGVLFAHWSAFQIVWLFWFETLIIGGFNVLKMLTVGFFGKVNGKKAKTRLARIVKQVANGAETMFTVAFFTVHYGGWSLLLGLLVFALFGKVSRTPPEGFSMWWDIYVDNFRLAVSNGLGLAMLVLLASHGFSFVSNFLFKREYTRTSMDGLMLGPYARVVILDLAVFFGAFLILAIGSPLGVLALLVVFKIGLDLVLHLKERQHSGAIPIPFAKKE